MSINQETKLPYANTDPSLHYNHSEPKVKVPSWREDYIAMLNARDEQGAHELRLANDPDYAERCEVEAAAVFPVEHKPLSPVWANEDSEAA